MLFLVLVGENAVEKWNSGLGNVDPQLDRDNNSNSIRARYSPFTVLNPSPWVHLEILRVNNATLEYKSAKNCILVHTICGKYCLGP